MKKLLLISFGVILLIILGCAKFNTSYDKAFEEHHLSVLNGGSGSGDYLMGTKIPIEAEYKNDSVFTNWGGDIKYLDNANSIKATVTMPNNNITITANYTKNNIPTYTLTVTNGSGSGEYIEGKTVTVTAKDSTGYTFSAWTGDIGELDHANAKTAIVTMPNKNINITATYTEIKLVTKDGMRVITGGTFSMGSNNGESNEKPVHQVTVGW